MKIDCQYTSFGLLYVYVLPVCPWAISYSFTIIMCISVSSHISMSNHEHNIDS